MLILVNMMKHKHPIVEKRKILIYSSIRLQKLMSIEFKLFSFRGVCALFIYFIISQNNVKLCELFIY